MYLRSKCILLLLDGMSYNYELSLSGLMCHLRLCFLIDFLSDLPIGISRGVKAHHYYCITVDLPFYGC